MDFRHIASGIRTGITDSIREWHRKISHDKQETRETSQTTRKGGPSREGADCEEVMLRSFLEISSCMAWLQWFIRSVLHLWLTETRPHSSEQTRILQDKFSPRLNIAWFIPTSWVSSMHARFCRQNLPQTEYSHPDKIPSHLKAHVNRDLAGNVKFWT